MRCSAPRAGRPSRPIWTPPAAKAPPREPVASPFHGGVCVESYQLVPLLKALRMPRVSLLIADDVVLLSIEEIGVNALRETFHRWIRTLALSVRDGEIGALLAHVPARMRRGAPEVGVSDERERAGEIIEEVSAGLRAWLRTYKDELTERLATQLRVDGEAARRREDERYRQRQGEVSTLIEQSTLARLTREIEQLRERGRQGQLFDETERLAEMERSIEEKQEELARRNATTRRSATSCSASVPASWTISCPRASGWPAMRRRFLWPWRSGCRNNAREVEFPPPRRRDGRQLVTPTRLRAASRHDSFYS